MILCYINVVVVGKERKQMGIDLYPSYNRQRHAELAAERQRKMVAMEYATEKQLLEIIYISM